MRINIEKPLTSADIKVLHRRERQAHRWGILATVLAVYGMPALVIGLLAPVFGDPKTGAIFGLSAIGCGLLSGGIMCCVNIFSDETSPVPKARCGELLSVFKEWPEVEPYRQAVLREGREFVIGEIEALKDEGKRLRQTHADQKNCQALYQAQA